MSKQPNQCELCLEVMVSGLRHAKRSACFPCIDKAIDFYFANNLLEGQTRLYEFMGVEE